MTNTLGIDFAEDVGEFVMDLPVVLTWSGQTISGVASTFSREDEPELAGMINGAEREWMGKLEDFTSSTPPALRATVSIGGLSFTVMRREYNEDGDVVKLGLKRKP